MNGHYDKDLLFKFKKIGWVEYFNVEPTSPDSFSTVVIWTELGKEKMRSIYPVLDELGFIDGYIVGQPEALISLCRYCIQTHGDGSSGKP
jgi:hypothetical protein